MMEYIANDISFVMLVCINPHHLRCHFSLRFESTWNRHENTDFSKLYCTTQLLIQILFTTLFLALRSCDFFLGVLHYNVKRAIF